MRDGKNILLASITTLISAPIAYWVLGEAVVYYEMWATEAGSRAELVNDFGLGILGFFVVLPGTLVCAVFVAWTTLRRLRKKGDSNAASA